MNRIPQYYPWLCWTVTFNIFGGKKVAESRSPRSVPWDCVSENLFSSECRETNSCSDPVWTPPWITHMMFVNLKDMLCKSCSLPRSVYDQLALKVLKTQKTEQIWTHWLQCELLVNWTSSTMIKLRVFGERSLQNCTCHLIMSEGSKVCVCILTDQIKTVWSFLIDLKINVSLDCLVTF